MHSESGNGRLDVPAAYKDLMENLKNLTLTWGHGFHISDAKSIENDEGEADDDDDEGRLLTD